MVDLDRTPRKKDLAANQESVCREKNGGKKFGRWVKVGLEGLGEQCS